MKEVKVINIMADGTVCEDLSTYLNEDHPLPELAKRLIVDFIRQGAQILANQPKAEKT